MRMCVTNNITQIMNVTACYLIEQNVFYEEIVSGCAICKNETEAGTPENVPCGKKLQYFAYAHRCSKINCLQHVC